MSPTRYRTRTARAARIAARRRLARMWAKTLRYCEGPFRGPGEAMVY